MKKAFLLLALALLIGLTGCEGTANNNFVADLFIGNEWMMLLVSAILIIPSIFAVTSEGGLHFYARTFRSRRGLWRRHEITEFDLTMAKLSAYLTLVLGGLILLFSLYYLLFY
jgi:hypothetical protein